MTATAPVRHDADQLLEAVRALRTEVGRRIVGQERVVEEILMALVAGGHALLVGVPGLAKTLTIKSVAEAIAVATPAILPMPIRPESDMASAWNDETPAADCRLRNISRSISRKPRTCMNRVRMEK